MDLYVLMCKYSIREKHISMLIEDKSMMDFDNVFVD